MEKNEQVSLLDVSARKYSGVSTVKNEEEKSNISFSQIRTVGIISGKEDKTSVPFVKELSTATKINEKREKVA